LDPDGSFTYTPQTDYNGPDSFAYEVCDDAPVPLCDVGAVNIAVAAVNDAPSLSGIADSTTDEDTSTGDINFTVSDVDTAVGGLMVTGNSSNTTLLPNSNITFGGSGANRTVNVTPAVDRSGTTEITLTVSDGILEATEAFLLTVRDVTAPDTSLDSAPPDFTRSKAASFSFSSETGAIFECSLDSTAFEICDSPENYPNLAQGEHTFQARAIDVAGNVDTSPITRTWMVDSVAPAGTVSVNGGASHTNRAQVSLTLGISDPSPSSGIASMRFRGGATAWSAWEPYAARKSWTLGAGNGRKTISVQYKDLAGNLANARATIMLDSIAPRVTRLAPAENATGIAPTANVTAFFSEAMRSSSVNASTVKIYQEGSATALPATVTYDATTRKATLDPNADLQPGTRYKVVVGAATRDEAGNPLDQDPNLTGNQSKSWFFTVRN
jgi:hypothetical protein